MSIRGQRVKFETLRSLAFGSISGTYTAVGTPLLNAARLIIVTNQSNADMLVSFDGVNNHMFVISSSALVLDFASNKVGPVDQLELPSHTQVYVKQASGAASSGSVYLAVVYASQS